jgi:hypothetical protein
MSGVGSGLWNSQERLIYAKLMSVGFSEQALWNSGLNAVRKAIESEVAASTVKYSEEDTTLDAAVFLSSNEAIKINISTRCWLLILIILNNLVSC